MSQADSKLTLNQDNNMQALADRLLSRGHIQALDRQYRTGQRLARSKSGYPRATERTRSRRVGHRRFEPRARRAQSQCGGLTMPACGRGLVVVLTNAKGKELDRRDAPNGAAAFYFTITTSRHN